MCDKLPANNEQTKFMSVPEADDLPIKPAKKNHEKPQVKTVKV